MSKKIEYDNNISSCPICDVSIIKGNLSKHISIVHSLDNINKSEKKNKTVNLKKEIKDTTEDLRARRLQRNILYTLFIAIIVLLPVAYAITFSSEEIYTGKSSSLYGGFTPAPNFLSVNVVTEETISLKQFKGRIVLLNFVNYGCNQRTNQIVSEQLLAIKSLKEQRDDFIPVSVFCGCCPEETLRNFATDNEFSWPWILDSDYSIIGIPEYLDCVKTYNYPTLVFINKEQFIVDSSGYNDVSTLSSLIDKML